MKAKWHFRKKHPGEITRDPVVGEFFSTDAIDNPAEALVREGIQNALDAKLESASQVRIRIFISKGNKSISENWLGDAWQHYKAKGNGLQNIPLETENCPYLVFEDFGTTGLYGDETQDTDSGEKNPFFYFFRAEARSGKSGEDRGRWGVGKHVFPRSSRISTYFGMTVRATDKKRMLMGHAILKYHEVAKSHFSPDGYLGVWQESRQDDQLVLPFTDEKITEEFAKDFNLSRKHETGLSIVVPHIDPEITIEKIKQAVITGYFLPIIENKLLVTIEDDERKTEIGQSTIAQESIGLTDDKGNDFSSTLKFASWCINESQEDLYMLHPCPDIPPSWKDDLIPTHLKRAMKEDLDTGKYMAIRVPLKVATEEGAVSSYFYVYLGPDNNKSARTVFVREGITISNVKSPRLSGIRALVVVNHKPLASLLGDSENPAHTEWQKGSQVFKNKHPDGRHYIDFVSNSVSRLINALSAEENEKDPYLLSDIFSLPITGEKQNNNQSDSNGKTGEDLEHTKKTRMEQIQTKPSPFTVSKTKNGFKVTPNTVFDNLPFRFRILVAYNVRKGNPLKKYNDVDFQIKDSMIKGKGITVIRAEGNEILLEVVALDFEIEVNGFDTKRDLTVKPEIVEGGEDD